MDGCGRDYILLRSVTWLFLCLGYQDWAQLANKQINKRSQGTFYHDIPPTFSVYGLFMIL